MKKTLAKILAIALCAVLLVSGTIYITLAYLQTKTEVVKNTFTVSNIYLSLDESKVKPDGTRDPEATGRVLENDYKLIPGSSYIKDPIVHVEEGSENCYLVIAIHETLFSGGGITEEKYVFTDKNNEQKTATIEEQMTMNGWVKLTNYHIKEDYFKGLMESWKADHSYTLYYYNGIAEAKKDYPIFEGFKLGDIEQDRLTALQADGAEAPTFEIVAFGMQTTGYGAEFDAAADDAAKIPIAFEATFGEKVTTNNQGGDTNTNN